MIRRIAVLIAALAAMFLTQPAFAQEGPPTLRQARQRLGYAMSQIDNATKADSLQRYHIALAVEAINAALALADSLAVRVDTVYAQRDSLRVVTAVDSVVHGDTTLFYILTYWPTRVDTGTVEIMWQAPAPIDSLYIRPGGEIEIVLTDGMRGVHSNVNVVQQSGDPEPENRIEWRASTWTNPQGVSGVDLEVMATAGGTVSIAVTEGGGINNRPREFTVTTVAGQWREVGWWQLQSGRNVILLTAPNAAPTQALRIVE